MLACGDLRTSRPRFRHRCPASELINNIIANETNAPKEDIFLQGPRELTAKGDSNLLTLAVANALRNAIEATAHVQSHSSSVIVSWGETDVDYWISILDQGPGISGPSDSAFKIGRTTKAGHTGLDWQLHRKLTCNRRGRRAPGSTSGG